ncbi:MAG: hypothetical protein AAF492_09795, partial [Verrucomicrobiota bacterium]
MNFKRVTNGLVITQFYDVGSWDTVSHVLGGGAQDQGTNLTTGGLTWSNILSADGGYLVIDPTDPRRMYAETQNTRIFRTLDGTNQWTLKTSGLDDNRQWVGVITMDPNDRLTLYTGTRSVYKSTDGLDSAWTAVSQDFGVEVSTIAVAPTDSMRVYAGTGHYKERTGQGRVFRTLDAGATQNWDDITGTLPSERPVMDIIVDPGDENVLVVAYGRSTGGAASHVFISIDAGAAEPTWTDISGNLPDITVSAIAFDPNHLSTIFAGTDVGVFVTRNRGDSWVPYDNGIPNCPIHDLHADASDNVLYAASFGRGMYKLNIAPDAVTPPVDVYLRDNILDTGERFPSVSVEPDPLDIDHMVYWWESADIKVDAAPYFDPGGLFDGVLFDRDLQHEDPVRGETNRFFLQVHNRGPEDATEVSVRIFIADASAGTRPLPNPLIPPDFELDEEGDWTPLGQAKIIPRLEPNRPVIVGWGYTVPESAATNSCLLAVVSAAEDPITTSETYVPTLVQFDKRVSLKNVHIIDVEPSSENKMAVIDFNNVEDKDSTMDIEVHFASMAEGNMGLLLEPHEFDNEDEAFTNVDVIELSDGEYSGEWYVKPSRIRSSDRHESEREKEIIERLDREVKSRLDLSRIYDFDAAKVGAIRGIRLKRGQKLRGAVVIRPNGLAAPGAVPRITICQKQQGDMVGGSTYEIRVKRTRGMHPVSRIRIVLEQVQILGDHDSGFEGHGTFVFNAEVTFNKNPNRRYTVRVPKRGVIQPDDPA